MTVLADQAPPNPDTEIAAARLEMQTGHAPEAVARLRNLIALAPFNPVHSYWLAAALGAAGDWAAHHETLNKAQAFHALQLIKAAGGDLLRLQGEADYAAMIGESFFQRDLVATASVGLGRGAMRADAPIQTILDYGLSLQHQGRIEEAVAAFTWAHAANPGSAKGYGFLLDAVFDGEDGVRRHAEEAQRWRELYGAVQPAARRAFDCEDPQGRPLRIGYVAPSFAGRLSQTIAPVLDHHAPERAWVALYVQGEGDAAGMRADVVRAIGRLDDAAAAELIRSDRIDVLVDLCGHAPLGRLGVFIQKPAPVQVAWLDQGRTTGAPEIDYLIFADAMDVPGAQADVVETIWRIGPTLSPFRPDPRPDLTPTPARAAGCVTFASYGGPARMTDQTLDAWARILVRVPGSRLLLQDRYFVDEVLQGATLMRFVARGVEPERLVLQGASVQPAYYQSLAAVDLMLDPSPRPALTACLDALANGVPVLTLAGSDPASRLGAMAVASLGLDDLVVDGWDAYVDRAVALVSDLDALGALRATVRAAFDRSSLRDEAGFARRLEAAFADMVAHWSVEGSSSSIEFAMPSMGKSKKR